MTHRILGSLTILFASAAVVGAESTPAEILRESGVRGGLMVHLGTTDGAMEIASTQNGFACVHGLALTAEGREQARKAVREKGLEGVAVIESATSWTKLPYVDNLVNLMVADLDAAGGKAPAKGEIERVLVPLGVAYLKQDGKWSKVVKPRPKEMGEWTHPLHGPDEGRSSTDRTLGVPRGVQWLAGTTFAAAGRKSSTESMVSAGGRVFMMTQNDLSNLGKKERDAVNYLVARDAFNGLLLWKRVSRGKHLGRSGAVNPRLVATADRLYAVEDNDVAALDAATGEVVQKYPTESFPEKFLLTEGLLIVETEEGVTAFRPDSGQKAWEHRTEGEASGTVANDRLVCCLDTDKDEGRFLVVLDLKEGKQLWRKRLHDARVKAYSKDYLDIAFLHEAGVGLVGPEYLVLLSAKDGKEVWKHEIKDNKYGLTYLADGLVWVLDGKNVHGLDPKTGKEQKTVKRPGSVDMCQPHFATGNFIIDPRHPTLVDLQTGETSTFNFTRGNCGTGFVAANGLLYTAPNACACYRDALRGFVTATSSQRMPAELPVPESRLEIGPANGDEGLRSDPAEEDAWPTYRHDAFRSGHTPGAGPDQLGQTWSVEVVDPDWKARDEWLMRGADVVSPPVIAGGRVHLACPDQHRLVTLDARTGKKLWEFTAGGRIDTPPTIAGDLCLAGSRDGWVYCLGAEDGELVWRFRAAPVDARIIAHGQLESVWPVQGGVLVHDGLAYAVAGRTPEADGGIHVVALEPRTGKLAWSRTITKPNKGGLPDMLVASKESLHVAGYQLDWKTGEVGEEKKTARYLRGGIAGMREATWTRIPLGLRKNIQTWMYDKAAGQLLSFSGEQTVGYDTNSAGRDVRKKDDDVLFSTGEESWKSEIPSPVQVEAMVLTRTRVFLAGCKDRGNRKAGGFVRSVSAGDGDVESEVELSAPPVYDGMAVVKDRLYLTTEDGRLICLGR